MNVTVRLNTAVLTALSECPVAVKTLTVDMEPAALLAVSASRSVFYTRKAKRCAYKKLIRLFVAGNAEHNRLIMMLLFDIPLFNYCLV